MHQLSLVKGITQCNAKARCDKCKVISVSIEGSKGLKILIVKEEQMMDSGDVSMIITIILHHHLLNCL